MQKITLLHYIFQPLHWSSKLPRSVSIKKCSTENVSGTKGCLFVLYPSSLLCNGESLFGTRNTHQQDLQPVNAQKASLPSVDVPRISTGSLGVWAFLGSVGRCTPEGDAIEALGTIGGHLLMIICRYFTDGHLWIIIKLTTTTTAIPAHSTTTCSLHTIIAQSLW